MVTINLDFLFQSYPVPLANLSSVIIRHPLGYRYTGANLWSTQETVPLNSNGISDFSLSWIDLLQKGLSEYEIGDVIYHYCLRNLNTRALVFFDLSEKSILQLLQYCSQHEQVTFAYAAKFYLNNLASENVMEVCYGHKDWFTQSHARRMALERFSVAPQLMLLIIESESSVTDLKERLRKRLPDRTFDRRIHSTDTHSETVSLIESLSNPNTLDLLHRVRISRKLSLFHRIPKHLRDSYKYCISGGSILELYGIRPAKDLDYLAFEQIPASSITTGLDVNSPEPLESDLIIRDPRLHLIIYGVKFASLNCRFLSLALETYPGSQFWDITKARRDYRLIANFLSQSNQSRFRLLVLSATVRTRIRQYYEFLVKRIVPHLPFGLNVVVPAIRRRLGSKTTSK